MSSIYCSKKYQAYPFAHRVHNHDGHCSLIHGHSWDFEIQFTALKDVDKTGFVIDLGRLGDIKGFLDEKFDHTLVLRRDDPLLAEFKKLEDKDALKIVEVDDCSSEGLALYVYREINHMVEEQTDYRATVASVTVREDNKNSATFIAHE